MWVGFTGIYGFILYNQNQQSCISRESIKMPPAISLNKTQGYTFILRKRGMPGGEKNRVLEEDRQVTHGR